MKMNSNKLNLSILWATFVLLIINSCNSKDKEQPTLTNEFYLGIDTKCFAIKKNNPNCKEPRIGFELAIPKIEYHTNEDIQKLINEELAEIAFSLYSERPIYEDSCNCQVLNNTPTLIFDNHCDSLTVILKKSTGDLLARTGPILSLWVMGETFPSTYPYKNEVLKVANINKSNGKNITINDVFVLNEKNQNILLQNIEKTILAQKGNTNEDYNLFIQYLKTKNDLSELKFNVVETENTLPDKIINYDVRFWYLTPKGYHIDIDLSLKEVSNIVRLNQILTPDNI